MFVVQRKRDIAEKCAARRELRLHSVMGAVRAVGCVVTFLVFLLLSYAQTSLAALAPVLETSTPTQINRTVLALYDSTSDGNSDESRIHKYLELPLNHLGYKLEFWDVSTGLPTFAEIDSYQRVVTWFTGPLARPDAYLDWVSAVAKTGGRFAILDHPGIPLNEEYQPHLNTLMKHLGLRVSGSVKVTYKSKITDIDKAMLGFEHQIDSVLPEYPVVEITDDRVASHLSISHELVSVAPNSAVVTTGPGGGYVPTGYTMFNETSIERVQWILNPFHFLKLAFADGLKPVPDVTTLSGRRLYFSHIDGDGWNNVSEIESYRASGTLSSEVVMRELITPYPDMPVSVALIAGDVDPEIEVTGNARKVAKELFRLPQVEVGSHTYTHPYDWSFFKDYSRETELKMISQFARETRPKPYQKILGTVVANLGLERFRSDIDKYISGSDALPRTFLKEAFDLRHEIEGSLDVATSLAPRGKRAMVFQWSGNTDPFAAAIRMTRDLGVRNINGGDSRFDGSYPSVAYVPPIARPVKEERQIYAVNSNENTYTKDWTGPYYAQHFLEETLRNTEMSRRLKGVNVYYHMYTGEKPASLKAVKELIEKSRSGKLIPIATSEYAALADSFFEVEISQIAPMVWRVSNRDSLQTVRFDEANRYSVNLHASKGVIGQNRHAGALYVTLDPDVMEAEVALTDLSESPEVLPVPHLVESRWRFSGMDRQSCGFGVQATGYGKGAMTWDGLHASSYKVTARKGASIVWSEEIATKEGQLSITVDANARNPVQIEFECIEKQREAAWRPAKSS